MKVIGFLLLFSFAFCSYAQEFKWGLGGVLFNTDHYRGSDQNKYSGLPLPYISYKSENIEAESSFVRGKIFESGPLTLKLSAIIGLSVESETNRTRNGMPDLDYTFELGPMIVYKIMDFKSIDSKLTFEMPIRKVFATDLSYVGARGTFIIPFFSFETMPRKWNNYWSSHYSIAFMWGSKSYHNYFYGVSKDFSTSTRPAYDSKSGYSGTHINLIFEKQFGPILLIPFLRYDYLKGAAFDDGPLHKSDHYFIGGAGIFYIF